MDPLPPRRGGAPAAPALSPALAAAKALLDRDVKDILTVRARASFDPGAVWATAPLLYPRRIPWPRGPREQPRERSVEGAGGEKLVACALQKKTARARVTAWQAQGRALRLALRRPALRGAWSAP